MRIPLSWLSDYVDLTLPVDELAERLTIAGMEVAEISRASGDWVGVRTGQVVDLQRHPNADRLMLATVDLGDQRQTVVCGAPNVAVGQKIAFASEGTVLIDPRSGKPSPLKSAVIRGVRSSGMICSEKELGISQSHEGIMVLPPETPVGHALSSVLGETVFDFDLRTNRPDAFSVLGIAREVSAIVRQPVREPEVEYTAEAEAIEGRVKVSIADPELCPRYCAALVRDVKIGPSPDWMQKRLTAAGLRPINNIVDITNYVMLEMGQPLHAFDLAKLRENTIVVRTASPGESITLLDGSKIDLAPDMLVIADASVPVAVAGVMGGADSEVDASTSIVLLESANFRGPSIRRTSQVLKVRTEASNRFEKGLSRHLPLLAARRAVKLMVELCGANAAKGIIDVFPGNEKEVRITVDRERLERVLGMKLEPGQVRQALMSLGFGCRWAPPNRFVVRVPYWRTDVHIPDDVAEELARAIGYDRIPMNRLRGELPASEPRPARDLKERLRDTLAAAGMQEVITYPLTNSETLSRVISPQYMASNPPLRLHNPMSRELDCLRTTLRAGLLQSLARNLRVRPGLLALFEIASVFLPRRDDLPLEKEQLCAVISGQRPDRWGLPSRESVDFYDAVGHLDALFAALKLQAAYEQTDQFAFLPGRVAAVSVGGKQVGIVGQVHPEVAAQFDIEQDTFLIEL
ncbi:MAG TPA: phenylalanine--tRNA ligase subunit beta, partial [Dehalococcoidia bacterium]|nr:phenylalanine--tRNA ligase subunit beta [Dehalococcoidia bacterium]